MRPRIWSLEIAQPSGFDRKTLKSKVVSKLSSSILTFPSQFCISCFVPGENFRVGFTHLYTKLQLDVETLHGLTRTKPQNASVLGSSATAVHPEDLKPSIHVLQSRRFPDAGTSDLVGKQRGEFRESTCLCLSMAAYDKRGETKELFTSFGSTVLTPIPKHGLQEAADGCLAQASSRTLPKHAHAFEPLGLARGLSAVDRIRTFRVFRALV